MKITTIKKRLIKQTVLVAIMLGILGGIMWYVKSLDEESNQNISRLKSQTNSIARQVANLSEEYSRVAGYIDIYSKIKEKQKHKMLSVSKHALRDVIMESRGRYYLDGLDVKMDKIIPNGGSYKRETSFVESSGITISLNALSDLDIFGLVQTLYKSFSGIRFVSLKFSSVGELDNKDLIIIKNTGFAPMVTARIKFTLFGLQTINLDEKELLSE